MLLLPWSDSAFRAWARNETASASLGLTHALKSTCAERAGEPTGAVAEAAAYCGTGAAVAAAR